jgi:hypothetical protein
MVFCMGTQHWVILKNSDHIRQSNITGDLRSNICMILHTHKLLIIKLLYNADNHGGVTDL